MFFVVIKTINALFCHHKAQKTRKEKEKMMKMMTFVFLKRLK